MSRKPPAWALVLVVGLWSGHTFAEQPPEGAVAAPTPIALAEPDYPALARERGVEADVELILLVDTKGDVVSSDVVHVTLSPEQSDAASHAMVSELSAAARASAARFVFLPARRQGAIVAARIRLVQEFRLPEVTSTVPVTAPGDDPVIHDSRSTLDGPVAPGSAARDEDVEVVVHGQKEADRLRESAEAVQVVETERAAREAADLGSVLARSQGVGVRRSGGLGSSTRFSLNGMTDDQIRFFVDGVPLEFSGFIDVSVVPVNLLERVELYEGVVPLRFGTDALGGAVNLVSDDDYRRSRASVSYQAGSFGTQRFNLGARHRFAGTPFVIAGAAFVDAADNDYQVDVEVPDEVGNPVPARVHRFHDAYRAAGTMLEAGVVERAWAQRLLLRLHLTDTAKDIQHNQFMTRPYGEVELREQAHGATLRYDEPLHFAPGLKLSTVGAYTRRKVRFVDDSEFVYDWFGRHVGERPLGGEIELAEDTTYLEQRGLARLGLSYLLAPEHQLRGVGTFNVTSRTGENHLYQGTLFLDPASATQTMLTFIGGVEYETDLFLDRLESVAFFKQYYYGLRGEEGGQFGRAPVDEGFVAIQTDVGDWGVGEQLRYHFSDWALAKASYEYALRFPDSEQVFGDGALTLGNLELEPERSHNANLGVFIADARAGEHSLRGGLNGFLRDANQLILALPLGLDRFRYHNLWSARAVGVEANAGWTSPGRYLWLDANLTWVDQRNTATEGPYAEFHGDRIPNRPWLYANVSARLQASGLAHSEDEISLTWYLNYVKEFFRSWESAGRADEKLVIDAQLLQSLALTYVVHGTRTFSSSLELQNLTDEKAYDFLGVQKPGRAAYFKMTLEI